MGEEWNKRHDFPSGDSITFYYPGHDWCIKPPEEHKSGKCWNACPGRQAGASTLAKNDGSSKDWMGGRYEGFACDAVATLYARNPDDLSWMENKHTVQSAIEAAGLTAGADMRAKGERGTAAHKVLEELVEHDTVPAFTNGHEAAVISWFKSTRPEAQYTEQPVFDRKRGFAGMFDLQYGDQTATMIDLKTGGIFRAALIQLNIYRLGAAACGLRVPDRLAILDTHDDGSWAEIEVPINPGWAEAAIATHRNGKDIDRCLRQAIKTARRGPAPVGALA